MASKYGDGGDSYQRLIHRPLSTLLWHGCKTGDWSLRKSLAKFERQVGLEKFGEGERANEIAPHLAFKCGTPVICIQTFLLRAA